MSSGLYAAALTPTRSAAPTSRRAPRPAGSRSAPGSPASSAPPSAPAASAPAARGVEQGHEHDGALLERSRADPDCFALLFDRYAVELYRYVTRRLDPATADDLVSEAFLVAFRKRDRFDPGCEDARPWLYGIVTRLVSQHRRKEARKYRALARGAVAPVEENHDERVTSRVAAAGAQHQLGKAMGGLAARDRDVLLLFAWQELSYEQIAEGLGIPVGTVRSRLNRARRKLRKELDDPQTASSGEGLEP